MEFSPFIPAQKLRMVRKIPVPFLRKKWDESYQINLPKRFGHKGEVFEMICPKSDVTIFYPKSIFGKSDFYKKLSATNPYYQQEKWEYQEALRFIPLSSDVLEIGCGNGEFLSLCRSKKCHLVGLELNRGIHNLDPKNLRIIHAPWEQYLVKKKVRHSVIAAFQVLEHLPNPEVFFQRCNGGLRRGGLLIVGVPNKDSFIKDSFNLLDFPPHHMTRWSRKSFLVIAPRYGFQVVKIMDEPLAPYHVDYYLDTQRDKMRRQKDWRRFIFKPPWRSLIRGLLLLGLRKRIRGQTILAVLRKVR